jgi:hypothetical protein
MASKTISIIIISSLLLLTPGLTSVHLESGTFTTTPPAPSPDDQPPWWQTILDGLQSAWEGITTWLDGAVKELQHSIEQAINQFVQGLIDEVVKEVTQMIQNILNQTCGTALLLPAGAIAGVWAFSHRKGKQKHS